LCCQYIEKYNNPHQNAKKKRAYLFVLQKYFFKQMQSIEIQTNKKIKQNKRGKIFFGEDFAK